MNEMWEGGELFCLHCEAVWKYEGHFQDAPPSATYRAALRQALAHDAICEQNPLVQRIKMLEADRNPYHGR